MIKVRRSKDRGKTRLDWLESYHTFSFGDYDDPNYLGFRALRVINEDFVKPRKGFSTHGHRDMEILTCILEGALAHEDSMGNGSTIRPGEWQRMSAGTGVLHSEFNPSDKSPVHLLQIWILPEQKGVTPGYEQRAFDLEGKQNRLRLIASGNPQDSALKIHQKADVLELHLDAQKNVSYALREKRYAWVQVTQGKIRLNQETLQAGDGAAVERESSLDFHALESSELILFDLAQ